MRVSWDREQAITDYVVYYRQTNNIQRPDQEMSKVVSSSEKSVIIDGLVSGATYVFQVVARVTVGDKSVSGNRVGSSLTMITALPMTPTQNECPVQSHGVCKLKCYVTKLNIIIRVQKYTYIYVHNIYLAVMFRMASEMQDKICVFI